jgi:hypothetical protein
MATNAPFDNSSPPYFIYYSNASPFTDEYKKTVYCLEQLRLLEFLKGFHHETFNVHIHHPPRYVGWMRSPRE